MNSLMIYIVGVWMTCFRCWVCLFSSFSRVTMLLVSCYLLFDFSSRFDAAFSASVYIYYISFFCWCNNDCVLEQTKFFLPKNTLMSAVLPSLLSETYVLVNNYLSLSEAIISPTSVCMWVKEPLLSSLRLCVFLFVLWYWICGLLISEQTFMVDVEVVFFSFTWELVDFVSYLPRVFVVRQS